MTKSNTLVDRARHILELTALSVNDVQPIPILELANEHLTGLEEFFAVTLPREGLDEATCVYLDRLASAAGYLAKQLAEDPHGMIPVEDRALNSELDMPVPGQELDPVFHSLMPLQAVT